MSKKKNEPLASEIIAGLQAEGKRTALQVEAIEMIIGINNPQYLEKICDYLIVPYRLEHPYKDAPDEGTAGYYQNQIKQLADSLHTEGILKMLYEFARSARREEQEQEEKNND